MTPPTTTTETVPASEVIPGLGVGKFGLVSGPVRATSDLMLRAAVEIATGRRSLNGMFGSEREGGQSVIYLALTESPTTRTHNRLVDLLDEMAVRNVSSEAELLKRNLVVCNARTLTVESEEGLPVNPENPPKLIIIDDFSHFAPDLNFNAPSAVVGFISNTRAQALDLGAAVIFLCREQVIKSGTQIENCSAMCWTITGPEAGDGNPEYVLKDVKSNLVDRCPDQRFTQRANGVPVAADTTASSTH
jgi:hypothetical protein